MTIKKIKIKSSIVLYALGIIAVLLIIYSFLIEPNLISTNIVPIADEDLFSLFHDKKVVQISDLHITSVGHREKKLIKMLNRINPDILFITGDFLTNGRDERFCIEVLKQINKPAYGIWAILGNSDRFMRDGSPFEGANRFVGKLKNLGIRLLEDESERLILNESGDHLFIVGVEGFYLKRSKLDWILRDIPDDSAVILLSHYPNVLEKQTDVLTINLGEEEYKGVSGWGWQDNAFFEYDTGIVRFEKDGYHKLRVQSREDGVNIEQICLIAFADEESHTNASSQNSVKNSEDMYTSINPNANEMIIIKAGDIPDSHIFGSWKKVQDPSSRFDLVIKDIPGLGAKNEKPLLEPEDYFEADFYAKGNVDYHVWVRMKAENDSPSNDSIYVQFNDSINKKGEPVYRIGEFGVHSELEKIDLILAGHTHGGQIRLPIIGALDVVPNHTIPHDRGFFESQGTKIYINRGIGTALLPMRFRCSPEITIFQFLKAEKVS